MKETFKEIMHNMGAVITWGDDGPERDYGLEDPVRSFMKQVR